MLPSWLTGQSTSSPQSSDQGRHVVLGTSLNAPLMEDQQEVLFGCGCFWGAEKGFWRLPGVVSTAVGYAGGAVENPSYEQVCSGRTGHSEVVRVVWSSTAVDFSDLLKLFWECHDPTQGDRQGNDRGSQYRSAIYTFTDHQAELAKTSRNWYESELKKRGGNNITTEIAADQVFLEPKSITNSIWPDQAAGPIAQRCQVVCCLVTSLARTTNFQALSGVITTGQSVIVFCVEIIIQFP